MTKKEFKKQLRGCSKTHLKKLIEASEDKKMTFGEGTLKHKQAIWAIKQMDLELSSREISEFLQIHTNL